MNGNDLVFIEVRPNNNEPFQRLSSKGTYEEALMFVGFMRFHAGMKEDQYRIISVEGKNEPQHQ